ncbi:transcriptional regulator [Aurantimonas sp. Leaf443]|nr:transcriptional regulator [Aurantimonas sp. Leaf443]
MARRMTTATRKPRADSARNRERLLLSAAEVFRTGGGAASLEAVARHAGVGIGTLYRHFPTREALFEAVYRREVEQLAQLAEDLSGGDDPVGALRRWLHANIALVATKKGMLAALALAVDGSSDLYAYSRVRLTGAIARLLEPAVKAGALRGDVEAEDILHTLVGMCLLRKEPGWEDTVIRLVDIFLDGLRLRPGGAA